MGALFLKTKGPVSIDKSSFVFSVGNTILAGVVNRQGEYVNQSSWIHENGLAVRQYRFVGLHGTKMTQRESGCKSLDP